MRSGREARTEELVLVETELRGEGLACLRLGLGPTRPRSKDPR